MAITIQTNNDITLAAGYKFYGNGESITGTAGAVGVTIDGNGSVITSGSKGYRRMAGSWTITAWSLIADVSGTVSFTIKKCTTGEFPTTASIVAAANPALSSQQLNSSSSLGTWTVAIADGDILEWVIDASPTPATITRVTLQVTLAKA